MVDRAFKEWDKPSMSKHLQQLNVRSQHASRGAGVAVRSVALQANGDLLLGDLLLVLVIIPTLSGVALIA
ncbi:MAG: hypothetical protein BMS9Abin30_0483 [Gammaproteobacteria bacterium]|nr:MAG: hypothetical protein BMS9Abin30_0483 [Gammaproteobacteria bacterium]